MNLPQPRVTIIQGGVHPPGLVGYLIEIGFREERLQVLQYSELAGAELSEQSLVVLTGGSQSVTTMDERTLDDLGGVIDYCREAKIPVLGICLGCQIIAHHLGERIETLPGTLEGYDIRVLGVEGMWRSHHDYPVLEGDRWTVWKSHDGIPYWWESSTERLYGLQCHPDVNPSELHLFTRDPVLLAKAHLQHQEIHQANMTVLSRLLVYLGVHPMLSSSPP